MRPDLAHPPMTPAAAEKAARYHSEVVDLVKKAIAAHDVVVVGMGWNPHVKRARRALDEAGMKPEYVEIGNYAMRWRERLALKLWTGWPTFPQVFVKGTFVGGADLAQAGIADGTIAKLLGGGATA